MSAPASQRPTQEEPEREASRPTTRLPETRLEIGSEAEGSRFGRSGPEIRRSQGIRPRRARGPRRRSGALLAASLALVCLLGPRRVGAADASSGDEGVPDQPTAATLLVHGGTVVTMDPGDRVIADGAVAIRGERIVAVGPAAELEARYPDATRLDAAGRAVLPGLINAHTHLPMTLFRGLADDLDLMSFLRDHIFPAEARWVDEEFVRVGTRLGCLELLRGGVTTFVDMYYYEGAIAEETARCGLRAILGQTLLDVPAPDHATWEEATAATEAFLRTWSSHPRITPAVAPHAAYTVSGPHLQEAHALAARHDAPLLLHLSEAPAEIEQIRAAHGLGTIAYLDRLGILDDRVQGAHVVLPLEGEIELLARAGVGVAHCPQSNMKTAAGIAPVPEMLAAGVAVGLGTDGPASNNDLSLWEEMDTAAKLHKVARRDPTVLPAADVLAMATRGGARAIDLDDEIGSLEPGKKADLILVRLDGLHQIPVYDPISALVYATKASDVDTVIIDGRLVVAAGRVLTVDEAAVRADVETIRRRLVAARTSDAPP